MNREHWKELLPVIAAFAAGEDLEESNIYGEWLKLENPDFYRRPDCYRIAPKPRKVWINEYCGGSLSVPHNSKQLADSYGEADRIACHEIELPPLP